MEMYSLTAVEAWRPKLRPCLGTSWRLKALGLSLPLMLLAIWDISGAVDTSLRLRLHLHGASFLPAVTLASLSCDTCRIGLRPILWPLFDGYVCQSYFWTFHSWVPTRVRTLVYLLEGHDSGPIREQVAETHLFCLHSAWMLGTDAEPTLSQRHLQSIHISKAKWDPTKCS